MGRLLLCPLFGKPTKTRRVYVFIARICFPRRPRETVAVWQTTRSGSGTSRSTPPRRRRMTGPASTTRCRLGSPAGSRVS